MLPRKTDCNLFRLLGEVLGIFIANKTATNESFVAVLFFREHQFPLPMPHKALAYFARLAHTITGSETSLLTDNRHLLTFHKFVNFLSYFLTEDFSFCSTSAINNCLFVYFLSLFPQKIPFLSYFFRKKCAILNAYESVNSPGANQYCSEIKAGGLAEPTAITGGYIYGNLRH